MPNEPLFVYETKNEKGDFIVSISVFPSGIKIFENGKFRFIVVEDNQLKEISEKELFEKVIS